MVDPGPPSPPNGDRSRRFFFGRFFFGRSPSCFRESSSFLAVVMELRDLAAGFSSCPSQATSRRRDSSSFLLSISPRRSSGWIRIALLPPLSFIFFSLSTGTSIDLVRRGSADRFHAVMTRLVLSNLVKLFFSFLLFLPLLFGLFRFRLVLSLEGRIA